MENKRINQKMKFYHTEMKLQTAVIQAILLPNNCSTAAYNNSILY